MSDVMHQPIIVTHEGGVRFAAQVRSHRVIVDQPLPNGGGDSAPMPIELLGTALGTCIALYATQFLQSRGLPYEGVRVEVEQHKVSGPSRIGEFVAHVIPPASLSREHIELLQRVVTSCPVHNTLVRPAAMHVSIDARIAAAA